MSKSLEECKGEKTDTGFMAPEISLGVSDDFDKIRPDMKAEMARRSAVKAEKRERLNVFLGCSPKTVAYIVATQDHKVLAIKINICSHCSRIL